MSHMKEVTASPATKLIQKPINIKYVMFLVCFLQPFCWDIRYRRRLFWPIPYVEHIWREVVKIFCGPLTRNVKNPENDRLFDKLCTFPVTITP